MKPAITYTIFSVHGNWNQFMQLDLPALPHVTQVTCTIQGHKTRYLY